MGRALTADLRLNTLFDTTIVVVLSSRALAFLIGLDTGFYTVGVMSSRSTAIVRVVSMGTGFNTVIKVLTCRAHALGDGVLAGLGAAILMTGILTIQRALVVAGAGLGHLAQKHQPEVPTVGI